jgi:hypothetical protein
LEKASLAAEQGERQDNLLELAFLASAVEQIGNRPEEADDGVEFGNIAHQRSRNGFLRKGITVLAEVYEATGLNTR